MGSHKHDNELSYIIALYDQFSEIRTSIMLAVQQFRGISSCMQCSCLLLQSLLDLGPFCMNGPCQKSRNQWKSEEVTASEKKSRWLLEITNEITSFSKSLLKSRHFCDFEISYTLGHHVRALVKGLCVRVGIKCNSAPNVDNQHI